MYSTARGWLAGWLVDRDYIVSCHQTCCSVHNETYFWISYFFAHWWRILITFPRSSKQKSYSFRQGARWSRKNPISGHLYVVHSKPRLRFSEILGHTACSFQRTIKEKKPIPYATFSGTESFHNISRGHVHIQTCVHVVTRVVHHCGAVWFLTLHTLSQYVNHLFKLIIYVIFYKNIILFCSFKI